MAVLSPGLTEEQIISSVDSSPEILAQIQEIIIPIVVQTLESKFLGTTWHSIPYVSGD